MTEKTEKPSQRKLKKAREEGKVAKSGELVAALILVGGLALLWFFGKGLKEGLEAIFKVVFGQLNTLELEGVSRKLLPLVVPSVLWIMGGLVLVALLAHFVQTGWIWARPKGRQKGKSRVVLTLVKLVGVGLVGYFDWRSRRPFLGISNLFEEIFFFLMKVALVLLVIGIGDWFYQKWQYNKQMRMTRQEVKDEKRETEGDQETKSKMRRR